jgi:hypothetical protein
MTVPVANPWFPLLILAVLIFVPAPLYSSVGRAGAPDTIGSLGEYCDARIHAATNLDSSAA